MRTKLFFMLLFLSFAANSEEKGEVNYCHDDKINQDWIKKVDEFALGPEPDPDDIDGRSSAVIVWSDGAMFYLVASDQLDEATLLRIASSMYDNSLSHHS